MNEELSESNNVGHDAYEFFIFEIEGEYFAVSAVEVDQVMKIPPITPVPNSPESIIGIFHLRAKVVVALDLIRRMNLPRERPLAQQYVFVAHREKNYFAILIDHAVTVLRLPKAELLPIDQLVAAHIPPQYAKGMFTYIKEGHKKAHQERSFLIIPPGTPEAPLPSSTVSCPVLLLDLSLLLDQEDLQRVFQEPNPMPS